MIELTKGCEVKFLHGNEAILRGVINGDPMVTWDADKAQARCYIGVYVRATNDLLYVDVENLTHAESHSVKVSQ